MQKKKLLLSALVAVTGFGLLAPRAEAAPLSYTKGDLLLVFRADDNSPNSYIVNLGSAAQFKNATSAFTLNIGTIASDLSSPALFGPNWSTRSDLYWSVFGASNNPTGTTAAGDPTRTLYASRAEPTVGTRASAWTIASSSTQGIPASSFVSVGNAYQAIAGTTNNSTANSSVGYIQSDSATNSADSLLGGSHYLSFQYFNGGIEGNFATGASGTALSLFRMAPSTSIADNGKDGDYLGRFTITSGGLITFTPVPEPSAVALVTFALAALLFFRRRSRQPKQA